MLNKFTTVPHLCAQNKIKINKKIPLTSTAATLSIELRSQMYLFQYNKVKYSGTVMKYRNINIKKIENGIKKKDHK